MRRLTSGLAAAALSLVISSCGKNPADSQLMQNAVHNETNNVIVKANDGSGPRFYYLTSTRYFPLACNDPLKMENLIRSFGYPTTQIAVRSFDDFALNLANGVTINCDKESKVLYRAQFGDKTKYFFANNPQSRDLYMIGCIAVVDAIGLKLNEANDLDPALITNTIFDASDRNDVSCVSGAPMGSKVTWEAQREGAWTVAAGEEISQDFSAKLPTGGYADLNYETVESGNQACSWVQIRRAGPLLIVSGRTPADFANKSCTVRVTAAPGGVFEDKKEMKIQQPQTPTLTSNCPGSKNLAVNSDYPNCTVQTDFGSVQVVDQTCVETFSFDTTTNRLSVAKLPGPSQTCSIRLQGVLDSLKSTPLSFSVTASCGTGFVSNGSTCVRVSCGNGHVYEQRWDEPILGGSRSMVCMANGQALQESLSCSVIGYQPNAARTACELIRCGSHVYFERWDEAIANGKLVRQCLAPGSGTVVDHSCNTGYTKGTGFNCTPVYCGTFAGSPRYYPQTWYEDVANGKQPRTCTADRTVYNGTILCNSGYRLENGRCVAIPAACGSHPSGSSWTTNVTGGVKYWTCNNGHSSSRLECSEGYFEKNGSCILDTETDPPVCKLKPSHCDIRPR